MDYKEFNEKYGQEVYNMKVWICDYRLNYSADSRPIRHVKPIFVQIASNEELPKNKTVYYSNFHFRPISNKGTVLKQIIAPYDNTGYRGYTGVSLNIFLTQEECKNHYNEQCDQVITNYKRKINEIENCIKEAESLKII